MTISDNHQDGNRVQSIQEDRKPTEVDKAQISPGVKNQLSTEDKVDLPPESREMKKIQDVLTVTPDVRAERVDALKKLVESGQYDVKSDALADKMIKDFLWEMNR